MKKLRSLLLLAATFLFLKAQAQNICSQQFSTIKIKGAAGNIAAADARAMVLDILNVMGLKGNFEIRAADVANAAAVISNGKRFVLYNPAFISTLNEATGNDWASVSVLAHEIGHHLNGHTLGGTSEPAKELEADEFSGYIMQRLGATLDEAETAMKLAADINGTATHPGRTARITAIENGWNRASDQLAADIEANENDTLEHAVETIPVKKDDSIVKPASAIALPQKDILAFVFFTGDSTASYFITTSSQLVAIRNNRLFVLGIVKENNNAAYPFTIENKNARLYINTAGNIVDADDVIVGRIEINKEL